MPGATGAAPEVAVSNDGAWASRVSNGEIGIEGSIAEAEASATNGLLGTCGTKGITLASVLVWLGDGYQCTSAAGTAVRMATSHSK